MKGNGNKVFSEYILTTYNSRCPIKTLAQKDKEKPWISIDIRMNMKIRQNACILYKQNKIQTGVYNRFRNHVTSLTRAAKKSYFQNLLNSVKSDAKKSWNIIHNLRRSKQINNKTKIKSISNDNEMITNSYDIASKFYSHFISNWKKILDSIDSNNLADPLSYLKRHQQIHFSSKKCILWIFKMLSCSSKINLDGIEFNMY